VGVHRRHIPIEKRGPDRLCTSRRRTLLSRETDAHGREKRGSGENPKSKHVTSVAHVSPLRLIVRIPSIVMYNTQRY
jgi:hypothetical protein